VTSIFLTAHVVIALLTLGPVGVAGSMFPPFARTLSRDPSDAGARTVAGVLYRICRVYSVIALMIPAFGLIVAIQWTKLDQAWLLVSIALTVLAAALLTFGVLPAQRRVLAGTAAGSSAGRIAMLMGLFNLAWVGVAVLMVLQPGAPDS
jgi:hypothetical protein